MIDYVSEYSSTQLFVFTLFPFYSISQTIGAECPGPPACDDRGGGGWGARTHPAHLHPVRDVAGGRDSVEVLMWTTVVWARSLMKDKKNILKNQWTRYDRGWHVFVFQERDDYGVLVESLGGKMLDGQNFDPTCTHLVIGNPPTLIWSFFPRFMGYWTPFLFLDFNAPVELYFCLPGRCTSQKWKVFGLCGFREVGVTQILLWGL